ncbi:MAG TPA: hypothetical protein VJ576_06720 [Rhodocyclaceae bacterium]|nr:hypothetical protein [Rhodocyclaceae bacterium]
MQYTYTALEAAALWVGLDPAEIQARMDATDVARIEAEHREAVLQAHADDFMADAEWREKHEACAQCSTQEQCPEYRDEYVVYGEPEMPVLQCPQGFRQPPDATAPQISMPTKPEHRPRTQPTEGEFSDLPEFEKHYAWLRTAIDTNDLPGHLESIRAGDLRTWLSHNFPGECPAFLFHSNADNKVLMEELERTAAEREGLLAEISTIDANKKSLAIIGLLLAILDAKGVNQTAVHVDVNEKLGRHRSFGQRTIEDLFGKANEAYRKLVDQEADNIK